MRSTKIRYHRTVQTQSPIVGECALLMILQIHPSGAQTAILKEDIVSVCGRSLNHWTWKSHIVSPLEKNMGRDVTGVGDGVCLFWFLNTHNNHSFPRSHCHKPLKCTKQNFFLRSMLEIFNDATFPNERAAFNTSLSATSFLSNHCGTFFMHKVADTLSEKHPKHNTFQGCKPTTRFRPGEI